MHIANSNYNIIAIRKFVNTFICFLQTFLLTGLQGIYIIKGKRHYRSFTAATRKEAEFQAADYALKKKDKSVSRKTFGQALDDYIELVNEVVALGYDRDEALEEIDASLDSLLEERKPLAEEEISEELYNDILFGFECEEA